MNNTAKDQATPRPLKANINQDIIKNCKCLACGSTTITVEFHPEIVRAVNAHDELVEALKYALFVFNDITPQSSQEWGKPKHTEMIEKAIKKASE